MKLTKNIIAFQKGFICISNINIDNRSFAMTTQCELMHFGYMLNEDALKQLGYADKFDIISFHNEIINYLLEMTGGKRDYKPFYPGYPQQVMNMSENELLLNQLVYYWSNCKFIINDFSISKPTAFEHFEYKTITDGNESNFSNIFTTLVKSGQSLIPMDTEVIKWFLNNYEEIIFPEVIPFKENLAIILGEYVKAGKIIDNLPKLTTTDVLRIIVHLSGGDVSLPSVPRKIVSVRINYSIKRIENKERDLFKIRNFKRKERKSILSLLEKSNLDIRDMKLKAQRWIRVGEKIHPGDFSSEFPKSYNAFNKIRNTKVKSWYGEVQEAFNNNFEKGLIKLSERAGEFNRRLDWMLRTNGKERQQLIFKYFSQCCIKSSNKVLFEVYTHFENRMNPVTNRSIFKKGARNRTQLPNLPALKLEIIEEIQKIIFDSIKEKMKALPNLGDCWIDDKLKFIPLPTNMRSMSDSLVPTVRGERIPINCEKNIIRPFVHWMNNNRIDIDLHGYLFSKNNYMQFGFNGEHNNELGCYSGDVRYKIGPCAEYVDININNTIKKGYQYFLMVLHNYSGQFFKDIPECVVGVMEREFAESNPNWVPATVQNTIIPNCNSTFIIVGVYDLISREYIHLDLDYQLISNVYDGKSLYSVISPYLEPPKLSVYDLLKWHVEARGREVQKELAVTHFLYEDFSANYTKTLEYLGV